MLQPERALRLLDTLDGAAYALRIVCAGYWGRRVRLACLTAGLVSGALIAGLPSV